MKRFLSSLTLLLTLSIAAPAIQPLDSSLTATRTASAVYVCMSKGSVAYHSSDNCAGLNRCTHTVKAMSVAQATDLGKRACLKCY